MTEVVILIILFFFLVMLTYCIHCLFVLNRMWEQDFRDLADDE